MPHRRPRDLAVELDAHGAQARLNSLAELVRCNEVLFDSATDLLKLDGHASARGEGILRTLREGGWARKGEADRASARRRMGRRATARQRKEPGLAWPPPSLFRTTDQGFLERGDQQRDICVFLVREHALKGAEWQGGRRRAVDAAKEEMGRGGMTQGRVLTVGGANAA